MNIERYLERIHAVFKQERTLVYLTYLQQQHLFHIPFENLDVVYKKEIVLNEDILFHKIIEKNRGGFCYELNSLFCAFLQEIGFQAKLLSATVQDEQGKAFREESHATTLVLLNGKEYLVDVGFGDSVRQPLPLSGEMVRDVSGTHRIFQSQQHFCLQKKLNGKWITKYLFSTEEKAADSFKEACIFTQTSPTSPFTGRRIVTIATPRGRVTLSDNTLTIAHEETKTKKTFKEDQFFHILQTYFHIPSSSL